MRHNGMPAAHALTYTYTAICMFCFTLPQSRFYTFVSRPNTWPKNTAARQRECNLLLHRSPHVNTYADCVEIVFLHGLFSGARGFVITRDTRPKNASRFKARSSANSLGKRCLAFLPIIAQWKKRISWKKRFSDGSRGILKMSSSGISLEKWSDSHLNWGHRLNVMKKTKLQATLQDTMQ